VIPHFTDENLRQLLPTSAENMADFPKNGTITGNAARYVEVLTGGDVCNDLVYTQ
jgi:hypothetical protein